MAEPQDWFAANAPVQAPPPPPAMPDVSAHAGRPAAGRGSQIDPDKSMRGLEAATTPMAHPTGVEAIDSFTSPLGLASLAAGGVGIARAGLSGGVGAGLKAAVESASPVVKYEITKSTLTAMGVPAPMAMAAALAISGYKKGAKPDPTALTSDEQAIVDAIKKRNAVITARAGRPTTAASAPAATASPDVSVPAPPAPGGEPVAPASAPPSTAELQSTPPAIRMGPDGRLVGRPGGNPDLPDQKALNEAALASRRAQPVAPPKSANVKLNAAETSAYLNLMLKGKSSSEAMASVLQQRELVSMLGTPTPTAADTKFPKGMRGKVGSSQ